MKCGIQKNPCVRAKMGSRAKALQQFQKLRRYQEASGNGFVYCISCGKLMFVKESQGGHYVSRSVRATELESDNVWPQCPRCNNHLSGNVVAYRANLVKLIGEERVRRIEDLANASRGDSEAYSRLDDNDKRSVVSKRNDVEYEQLAKFYRAKWLKIQKEKT